MVSKSTCSCGRMQPAGAALARRREMRRKSSLVAVDGWPTPQGPGLPLGQTCPIPQVTGETQGDPMSAFKDNLLAGQTALVAGGTSGINLGIAKPLAQLGA